MKPDTEAAATRAIQPVLAAMRQAVKAGQGIEMRDMALLAGYSRWHFARTFCAVAGETPGRYLTRLRYDRAAELLATTDMTIAQVATAVGYSSWGTFAARFHRRFGVTPRDHRRRARAEVAP